MTSSRLSTTATVPNAVVSIISQTNRPSGSPTDGWTDNMSSLVSPGPSSISTPIDNNDSDLGTETVTISIPITVTGDLPTSTVEVTLTQESTSTSPSVSSPTSSAEAPASPTQPRPTTGLSSGAKGGIGVGALALFLIIVGFLCWWNRRRKAPRRPPARHALSDEGYLLRPLEPRGRPYEPMGSPLDRELGSLPQPRPVAHPPHARSPAPIFLQQDIADGRVSPLQTYDQRVPSPDEPSRPQSPGPTPPKPILKLKGKAWAKFQNKKRLSLIAEEKEDEDEQPLLKQSDESAHRKSLGRHDETALPGQAM